MSNFIDGGPAFPVTDVHPGMSLHDYFAAHERLTDCDQPQHHVTTLQAEALAGVKAPSGIYDTNPIEWYLFEAKWRAALRYIRADAMIVEREKQRTGCL